MSTKSNKESLEIIRHDISFNKTFQWEEESQKSIQTKAIATPKKSNLRLNLMPQFMHSQKACNKDPKLSREPSSAVSSLK